MLNSILLFISLAIANDYTCTKSQILQIVFEKTFRETSEFCFNSEKNLFISRSCEFKKCQAFSSTSKYSIADLFSEYGKPGFVLCKKLGGEPDLVSFYINKKAYPFDRCIFPDGSFVDTGLLLQHYLN